MAVGMARIGDTTYGYCSLHMAWYNGTITGGSSDVFANSQGLARVGDTVTSNCGHTGTINSGSGTVNINGQGGARDGDSFTGIYFGNITSGSADVLTT